VLIVLGNTTLPELYVAIFQPFIVWRVSAIFLDIDTISLELKTTTPDDIVTTAAGGANFKEDLNIDLHHSNPPDTTEANTELRYLSSFTSHVPVTAEVDPHVLWGTRSGAKTQDIEQIMADTLKDAYDKPSVVFNGTLKGFFTPENTLLDLQNFERIYMITSMDLECKQLKNRVTAIEINPQGQLELPQLLDSTSANTFFGCAAEPNVSDINAIKVWVCGENDEVLKSTDGKTFADDSPAATAGEFRGITSRGQGNVFVGGSGGRGFYKAGGGWLDRTSAINTSNDIFDAFYEKSNSAPVALWICATGGVIERSTNDGAAFTSHTSNTSQDLESIYARNDGSRAWACGKAKAIVYWTSGTTWTVASVPGTNTKFNEIYFHQTLPIGWAVGNEVTSGIGTIWHSRDDGVTWTQEFTGSAGHKYNSVIMHPKDPLTIYLVGFDGTNSIFAKFRKGDSALTLYDANPKTTSSVLAISRGERWDTGTTEMTHKAFAAASLGDIFQMFLY